MSRKQRTRPPRMRSSRESYWRRMSWQEVEQALDHLFDRGLDNEEAQRYAQRFRRARSQVLSIFLGMMCSRDSQERSVAAFVLARMGGKQTIRSLQKICLDPDLNEVVRAEVVDLLQSLGAAPEEEKEAPPSRREPEPSRRPRREKERKPKALPSSSSLDSGKAGTSEEILALFQKKTGEVLQTLADGAMTAQMLSAFPNLSPKQQLAFIEKIGREGEKRALSFLLPLLQSSPSKGGGGREQEREALMEAALAAVGKVGLPEALPRLREMAAQGPRKRLKVKARQIVQELEKRVRSRETPAKEKMGPLYRAYATTVGGDGLQTLLVARERQDQRLCLLRIRHDDKQGLRECTFEEEITHLDLREILRQIRSEGLLVAEVPAGYCSQMVTSAVNLARRRKLPLSPDQGRAQQFCAPRRSSSQVVLKLEPAADIKALEETARLLDRPEFQSWRFDLSSHPSLLERWARARGQRNVSRQRRAAITHLIRAEVDDSFVARLRTRLQRQAYLLQRLKESEASEWARIAAAGLLKKHQIPPEEHPLLREMAAQSFQQFLEEGRKGPDSLSPPPSEPIRETKPGRERDRDRGAKVAPPEREEENLPEAWPEEEEAAPIEASPELRGEDTAAASEFGTGKAEAEAEAPETDLGPGAEPEEREGKGIWARRKPRRLLYSSRSLARRSRRR